MSRRGRIRSIGAEFSRRAWSRTGRVLDLVAASPNRRAYAYSWRFTLHLVGCAVIAGGVAMMLWNEFGPGPLDVFIGAVRRHTGLPLTFAVWLTTGSLLLAAWRLGKRPGIGNIVTMLIVGPLMQLTLTWLDRFPAPDSPVVKTLVHLLATAVVGLGAGMNLFADLGAGTGELVAKAAALRTGFAEPRVRMACEVSYLTVGVVLGGPIGLGTLIVAVLIGPFVARGQRTVDGAITSARVATLRQIAAARTPLDVTGPIPVMSLSAGE